MMSRWEEEAYPVAFKEWYDNEYLPKQDEYGQVGMDKAIHIWRVLQEQKLDEWRREAAAAEPQEKKTPVVDAAPQLSVEDDLNLQADSLAKTNEDLAKRREVEQAAADAASREEGMLGRAEVGAANDPRNYINLIPNRKWNNVKNAAEIMDKIGDASEYVFGANPLSTAAFGKANEIKSVIGDRSLSEYDKVRGSVDKGIFEGIYKPVSYIDVLADANKAEKEALANGASPEEAKKIGWERLVIGLGIQVTDASLGKVSKVSDWSLGGKMLWDGGKEMLAEAAKCNADKIVQGQPSSPDPEAAQDGFIKGVIKSIFGH